MQSKKIQKIRSRFQNDMPFFEFNLAEFPLFLLTKKAEGNYIEYEDEITYEGRQIKRYWKVTWPVKDPNSSRQPVAPTSFVRKVFFVLLQNIADNNFSTPIISFESRRHILKTIYPDREPSKDDYDQLDNAIFCLRNITIKAKNSFWNPESKKLILDTFELELFPEKISREEESEDGTKGERFIQFVLSPTLYTSIKSGGFFWINANYKDLIELSDTAFRYLILLTKKSYHDAFMARNLKEFIKQLPLYQSKSKEELSDADTRKAKYRITEAHKELVDKGYILDLPEPEFYKSRGELMIKIPSLTCIQTTLDLRTKDNNKSELTYNEINELAQKIAFVTGDSKSRGSWILISRNLPYDSVHKCLKDVEEAKRSGYVGNYGAIFTYYIQQVAAELKINPWAKRGSPKISASEADVEQVHNKKESPNELLDEVVHNFGHYKAKKDLEQIIAKYSSELVRKALDAYYDHTVKLMKTANIEEMKSDKAFQYFEYFIRKSEEVKTVPIELALN